MAVKAKQNPVLQQKQSPRDASASEASWHEKTNESLQGMHYFPNTTRWPKNADF